MLDILDVTTSSQMDEGGGDRGGQTNGFPTGKIRIGIQKTPCPPGHKNRTIEHVRYVLLSEDAADLRIQASKHRFPEGDYTVTSPMILGML